MLATKKIIPEFFGFEGVGILFRDSVKNTLFSVEDQEVEEDRKILNIKIAGFQSKPFTFSWTKRLGNWMGYNK